MRQKGRLKLSAAEDKKADMDTLMQDFCVYSKAAGQREERLG